MRNLDRFEYEVGTHFSCAIMNDDYSSLNEQELAQFQEFQQKVITDVGDHYTGVSMIWDIDYGSLENPDYGGWCEIMKLRSATMTLIVVVVA